MNLADLHIMVVDDEPDGVDYILELLHTFYPKVKNIHTAHDLSTAKKALLAHKMDILLLDIQLKEGAIFQLLKKPNLSQDAALIFVTGHKEYAYEAIKTKPFDYLLKPLSPSEFVKCIEKCIKHLRNKELYKEAISKGNKEIILTESGKHHNVKFSQILYCQSTGSYTTFYLDKDKKIMVSKSMIHYQKKLEEHHFFRIHKSYIVNINHIRSIKSEGSTAILISNGQHLPVSRRRRSSFIKSYKKDF